MAIRHKSQHSKCTTCLRYKLILKKLTSDRAAHQAQMEEFGRHLKRQYEDRIVYWKSRTNSRLMTLNGGYQEICIICDGMDKSKYKAPRSLALAAKEFSQLLRPSLDCHAAIAHGHSVTMALADVFVRKDSSFMTDLVAFVLNGIGEYTDLRQCHLSLQSDNTSKECKNSTLCRFLGYMVGSGKLYSASLSCLQTGHSHEDVDAMFGALSHVIEAHNELHDSLQFRQCLQDYLNDKSTRPNEPQKCAIMMNSVRAWCLGFNTYSVDFLCCVSCFFMRCAVARTLV